MEAKKSEKLCQSNVWLFAQWSLVTNGLAKLETQLKIIYLLKSTHVEVVAFFSSNFEVLQDKKKGRECKKYIAV